MRSTLPARCKGWLPSYALRKEGWFREGILANQRETESIAELYLRRSSLEVIHECL